MVLSLERYIEMKLQDIIFCDFILKIQVIGNYDRSKCISVKEKDDMIYRR